MIRVLIFLLVLCGLAFAGAWLADRPGEVSIVWQGWRIETSLMVAAVAIAGAFVGLAFVWSVARLILRSPDIVSLALRNRRRTRGFQAISRGMIAVGAGDSRAARRYAAEAERLMSREPLTLLLQAQAAQIAGDRNGAERSFNAMLAEPDTRLLGLRGLYVEALRREDAVTAAAIADEAHRDAPGLPWAGEAVLERKCAMGDWEGAREVLERIGSTGLLDKATLKRRRAVLLTAQALSHEETDPGRARALALEAVKNAPTLVPAAALAGRLFGAVGDVRKAAKIVETAWRAAPHPELAETYAHLRFGDAARDRLARVKTLARNPAFHPEGQIAIARAAIDAAEFKIARTAIEGLMERPTQRVCLLVAEIELKEHGDRGKARYWTARAVHAPRDPAWTADGHVSDRWMPVSPVTGRLDAFEWRVPVVDLGTGGPLIEAEEEPELLPVETAAVLPPQVVEAAPAPVSAPASAAPPQVQTPAPPPAPIPEPQAAPSPVAETAPAAPPPATETSSPPPTTRAAEPPATPRPDPKVIAAAAPPATKAATSAEATTPPLVVARVDEASARSPADRPAPVMAIVPAPDDPGPEPEPEREKRFRLFSR